MRLIINNILSPQDKNTILRGHGGEAIQQFDLQNISELKKILSDYDKHFFDCLSFLIAKRRLEVLVIEPIGNRGIAHTKSGIFYDNANFVAFNGSCNFTKTALLDNIENIDAFCDWDGGIQNAKVNNLQLDFEKKFSKQDTSIRYIDPKDIIDLIHDNFKEKELPELLEQEHSLLKLELNRAISSGPRENIKRILVDAELKLETFIAESRRQQNLPKFPWNSEPRDYQKVAFENWKKNGQKGLFVMATGTGKTITSLNCLLEIYKRCGYYKAIILVPTVTLLEQWVEECRRFKFNNIIKVYSRNARWQSDIDTIYLQEKRGSSGHTPCYVIISTYASYAKDNIFHILNTQLSKKILLIADEAHNMASRQLLNKLAAIKSERRIGLSATPERQFDDLGNEALLRFFSSDKQFTYEYTMKEAIENGVLCRYFYFPHVVVLTETEMKEYAELSLKIAKFASNDGILNNSDSVLSRLLLKRKRIIHKATNKKEKFKEIITDLYNANGTLQYTLVYVPEGNNPDDNANLPSEYDVPSLDDYSQHLIDQYTSIVRDVHPRVTVKQFTSTSRKREDILTEFAEGRLEVLTSMKCLDEGVDIPQSKVAIFCASTGNPRQFIQRRGRILRQSKSTHKHCAIIHDLVVVPEISQLNKSYNLERNLINNELNRVRNFALLSENSSSTLLSLNEVLSFYNLSLFANEI